jgi:MSHA biogenesis protein MshL
MKMRWIPLVLLCFLLSCAHSQKAEQKATTKPPDIPSPVSFQVDKEPKATARQPEDLYSFSLREADVKDILRAIAKQTDYNVVVEPDVKGLTTVDLKQVTLPKALEYILEPLNYTFKIEDRTIYVSKPKLETKIFHLNYIALKKIGKSKVYATPGTIGGTTSTTGATTTSTSTTGSQVTVESETESDLWKGLEDNIKGILSKDGKYVVNKQVMMIYVTDYPFQLKGIESFLKAAEGVIQRQVMIEAKIVEVYLNESSRQGINWSLLQGRIGEFNFRGSQVLLNPNVVQSGTTVAAGTPLFRMFVGNGNIDINNTFIDLLQTYGKVEIISSPKIATLNNQRAIIKVTRQDVYFDETQTSTSGVGNTVTYTPKFIDVGLTLDVTPQIDGRGNIIMSIHPIVSEKTTTVSSPSGNKVPVLDIREADTIVRAKEGETVVIGGLIKNRKSTADTGVKGLMNIPIIGQFFKLNEEEGTKTELVVFLTPKIIYDQER